MLFFRTCICVSLMSLVMATTTISLEVCQMTHRAHPESETKFQMLDGKYWIEVDCGHLIWNQMLCRCTYSKGTDRAACSDFVAGDKASLYKRWNGLMWEMHDCNNFGSKRSLVWNQEKCRCDWDADQTDQHQSTTIIPVKEVKEAPTECIVMLNLTFDDGFKDTTHKSSLQRYEPSRSYLVSDPSAIGGQAACFKDAPILVPHFIENTLSETFHISFNLRVCENRSMDYRLQTIFHNSCFIEGEGVIPATIALSFQAGRGMFLVDIDTEDSFIPVTDSCTTKLDPTKWNKVEMRYQYGVLSLVVNDKSCLSSKHAKGPVKGFKCPFVIPGEDFCGCLDEVVITKGCRV